MNRIILSGNICKDVETKYYNDRKYSKNTIAVRRDYKNSEGNYDSDFYNFTIWGQQAEFFGNYAKKGDKILICGKIMNNNYEKDGQMVYSYDIQVDNVELLTPKGDKEENVEEKAKEIFGEDVVEIDNGKTEKDLLD